MNLLTYSETERIEKLYRIYTKFPKVTKIWFLELLYYLNKLNLKRLKTPNAITFYVTYKCNAKCKHCFVWQELNKKEQELSLSEIKKIFLSLRHPLSRLAYAGGEPFLRDDLPEISKVLYKVSRVRKFWSGTNGLQPEKIYSLSEKIIENIKVPFVVTVSLEGFEQTHNKIFGVKDAFHKTLTTIKLLKNLMEKYPNKFQVRTLTTIMNKNIDEIEKLAGFIKNKLRVFPLFNFIWGSHTTCYSNNDDILSDFDPPDCDFKLSSLGQLIEINKKIDEKVGKNTLLARIESIRRKYVIEIIKNKKRLFPCTASRGNNASIYANGDVSFCEFTKIIGNLKSFDYAFPALYNSERARKIKNRLKNCTCNLPYILTSSMVENLRILKEILL